MRKSSGVEIEREVRCARRQNQAWRQKWNNYASMTLVFHSTTIHWILCINITARSVSTVHPSSSVLHILKSPLNLNSPDVTKFSFSTQYCQRNVTTRCNIARDLNSTAILDLLQVEFKYFTSARGRFFMFSEAKGSDRALRAGANYRNWKRLSSFV